MWVYPEIRFVGDLATYHAGREPHRLALRSGGRDIGFGELEAASNRIAHGLIAGGSVPGAGGLEPRQRVLFLGKNSADFFFALFGVVKAGACLVPLNWRLAPAELAEIVGDADGAMAFVEREFETCWAEIAQRRGRSIPTRIIDARTTVESIGAGQPETGPKPAISEDDPAIILYTSGTTGRPKGVLQTHGAFNHSRLSEHLEPAYDWREGDVFLFPLPNFHLLGIALSLQCLYNGVAVSIQRQFDPAALLAGIREDRPSLLVLTPTMIQMMLDHPDAAATDFSSVRMTMYAGSPIALGLIKRAIGAMPGQFMQFYGQTETSGPVSLLRPDEHDLTNEGRLKSCGRPLPLIALRVVDEEGRDLPDGVPGELLVRAPAQSGGYWRQPEETDARFRGGWYHTGDVAYRDADNLFYIYDRLKDMIVTGGENVYSAEVENVLSTHPDVAAVAVIGVPDPRWGEAVKAVVIRRAGAGSGAADLIGFCRENLAGYKVPKSVDFVEAFPLTGSGKVSKKDLRAPYWADQARAVA